jgi:hypothetical protein
MYRTSRIRHVMAPDLLETRLGTPARGECRAARSGAWRMPPAGALWLRDGKISYTGGLPGGGWLRSWPSRPPSTRAEPSRNLAPGQGRSSSGALHLDRGPEPGSTGVRVDGRRDGTSPHLALVSPTRALGGAVNITVTPNHPNGPPAVDVQALEQEAR